MSIGWLERMVYLAVGMGLAVFSACTEELAGPDIDPSGTDFDALRVWVGAEGSFSAVGMADALARIKELEGGPSGGEAGHFLDVASVVALADNGHSNVGLDPVLGFGILPIRTYWFSDGLFIVRARRSVSELIGARIDSIGGRSIDDLEALFTRYHGGTPEHFRQYFADPLLLSTGILTAAGICDCVDGVSLSVTLPSGGTGRFDVTPDPQPGDRARVAPWVKLVRSMLPGESSDWTWTTNPPSLPLALRETTRAFRYVHLPEYAAVYLQLRTNDDLGGERLADWVESARDRLREDRPTTIILDNRFNGGGNLTLTADFALDLPDMVPEDGRVFVLTSNATFSAGIYTSFYPKASDPERTMVVGEAVGDRARFWAETPGPVVLPRSQIRVGLSLQLHDLASGCSIPEVCHLAGKGRWDISVGSLAPDEEIGTTYSDYAEGRDPVLEWVLDRAGRSVSASRAPSVATLR